MVTAVEGVRVWDSERDDGKRKKEESLCESF
jgi:hypothetical protein